MEQVDTFPYLGSPITEDGECTTECSTRLNRGQAIGAWKSYSIPIFQRRYTLMIALVWPIAMYGCESWTLRKNEETRLDDFEMKWLRKILRVSWTTKKTKSGFSNKVGVKRELSDTVKARKLAYYGHTIRKQGSYPEKEIMQGTMPGARRRERPRTACMDGQHQAVKESIRMTEDRDTWKSTSMVCPTIGSRTAKEQNRTCVLGAPVGMTPIGISEESLGYRGLCLRGGQLSITAQHAMGLSSTLLITCLNLMFSCAILIYLDSNRVRVSYSHCSTDSFLGNLLHLYAPTWRYWRNNVALLIKDWGINCRCCNENGWYTLQASVHAKNNDYKQCWHIIELLCVSMPRGDLPQRRSLPSSYSRVIITGPMHRAEARGVAVLI